MFRLTVNNPSAIFYDNPSVLLALYYGLLAKRHDLNDGIDNLLRHTHTTALISFCVPDNSTRGVSLLFGLNPPISP